MASRPGQPQPHNPRRSDVMPPGSASNPHATRTRRPARCAAVRFLSLASSFLSDGTPLTDLSNSTKSRSGAWAILQAQQSPRRPPPRWPRPSRRGPRPAPFGSHASRGSHRQAPVMYPGIRKDAATLNSLRKPARDGWALASGNSVRSTQPDSPSTGLSQAASPAWPAEKQVQIITMRYLPGFGDEPINAY